MRILSGQWQNRTLAAPKGIRPMTEMVKQALFNILGELQGLSVLDIFAGSGQIGIEALSRGAQFAAFVEKEPRNAGHIREALKDLGVSAVSARVLTISALAYLPQTGTAFDLIVMDPPYEENLVNPCLKAVAGNPEILRAGGRLVVRHTKHEPVEEGNTGTLEPEFSRCYGDDVLRIWRKGAVGG